MKTLTAIPEPSAPSLTAGERFTLQQINLDTWMPCERVNARDAVILLKAGLIYYVHKCHGYCLTPAGRKAVQ